MHIPVYCSEPPSIQNAHHNAPKGQKTFDLDTSLQYQCNPGYTTSGFARAKCFFYNGTAKWFGPDFTCERKSEIMRVFKEGTITFRIPLGNRSFIYFQFFCYSSHLLWNPAGYPQWGKSRRNNGSFQLLLESIHSYTFSTHGFKGVYSKALRIYPPYFVQGINTSIIMDGFLISHGNEAVSKLSA